MEILRRGRALIKKLVDALILEFRLLGEEYAEIGILPKILQDEAEESLQAYRRVAVRGGA